MRELSFWHRSLILDTLKLPLSFIGHLGDPEGDLHGFLRGGCGPSNCLALSAAFDSHGELRSIHFFLSPVFGPLGWNLPMTSHPSATKHGRVGGSWVGWSVASSTLAPLCRTGFRETPT